MCVCVFVCVCKRPSECILVRGTQSLQPWLPGGLLSLGSPFDGNRERGGDKMKTRWRNGGWEDRRHVFYDLTCPSASFSQSGAVYCFMFSHFPVKVLFCSCCENERAITNSRIRAHRAQQSQFVFIDLLPRTFTSSPLSRFPGFSPVLPRGSIHKTFKELFYLKTQCFSLLKCVFPFLPKSRLIYIIKSSQLSSESQKEH